uniref:Neural cell expressed, developmentally down-regulated 1 n=1 Tax=Nothobranchius rachovii TaxID=451742 RepID=A0A1A8RL72_9TELE
MEEATCLVSTGDCVKIWDAVSMAPLEQFNPHSSSHPVAQACWSSNNQYLVSASSSGDKLVVSGLKSSPVPVVELADGKQQTRVCLSSSSQFLVSGGLDHCVHIWDLKNKRLHRSLRDHKEEVTCVSFNANDSCVASGSTSGDLVLHSLTTNLSSRAFGHGPNQPIHDLRMSPVKRSLLGSVSDSGTVVLWDANTQKELHTFDGSHKAPGSGLVFSPTSELLVVSVGLDKKIVFYDTASRIVLRSIRVDSPLTSVDFSLDGTGLVVGSTQGKVYHYDLRNSSTPTKVTSAHKTSVTCLRFQSNTSRHKSGKLGPSKGSSTKRSSSKLSGSHTDSTPSSGPASHRQVSVTAGGAAVEGASREAEGQPTQTFSSVGRNSLDIFSPVREGSDLGNQGKTGETLTGRTNVTREGEGQPLIGRGSLDIFSPVREDPGTGPQRRTPLGNQLAASAGWSYSPSVFQFPLPIKEEEPTTAGAVEPCDPKSQADLSSGSGLEGEPQTPPTSSQQTNQNQPAPHVTPEASLRRTNGVQTQPCYSSPVHIAPPTVAGPSVTLSQNVVGVAGQGGAAPFSALQLHFIQNMIHETLEDFRNSCHQDIINLQVEMIRQFYIQLTEIHGLIEKHSVNESLVEENERLREENRRLRANF